MPSAQVCAQGQMELKEVACLVRGRLQPSKRLPLLAAQLKAIIAFSLAVVGALSDVPPVLHPSGRCAGHRFARRAELCAAAVLPEAFTARNERSRLRSSEKGALSPAFRCSAAMVWMCSHTRW
mmetsp:Transcript_15514/g.39963  ORF Transcript_15514/g.39963 Transcript_15514/m.39963 type:complete len:123 (+) Transcript_15514:163-531(+)